MTQIAIIDDHKLVGAGFAHLIELEEKYNVAVICHSYQEAVELLNCEVDIAIIDISLPDQNGIELAKYLDKNLPSIKKIFVSMYDNVHYIKESQLSGGSAYLSKKCAPDELIAAIQVVDAGGEFYSKDIKAKLTHSQHQADDYSLTAREVEVLRMLARGLSSKQVVNELDIMPKTALAHRYNLFIKFNVNNQFDLLQKALEVGLLTSADISLCSV